MKVHAGFSLGNLGGAGGSGLLSHIFQWSEGGGEVDCRVEAGKLIEADEYIRWLSWNFSWPSTHSKGY